MKRIILAALTLTLGGFAGQAKADQIVVAGGCFWGVEAVFEHLKGVSDATSGYAGGAAATAHYDDVSTGSTGHAESVRVTYNPAQISLDQLLDVYFKVAHNPTELNFQGPDSGTQYRSAIFYTSAAQKQAAQTFISKLESNKVYSSQIVTKLEPLNAFYPAEAHHQNFAALNPNYPYIVEYDAPKVVQLKKSFPSLYTSR